MATLTIDIRHPDTADAAALADVCAKAWKDAYRGIIPDVDLRRIAARRNAEYWARVAQQAGGKVLVLSLDGMPRGYVSFGSNRSTRIAAQGEIYELYVDPVCQGAGLGRKLFDAARKRLGEQWQRGMVIWALDGNERADRFYRRIGGEIAAEDRFYFLSRNYRRIAYQWR